MYKKCKIIMLPSEVKSPIQKFGNQLRINPMSTYWMNLYIISSDEIKEDDWIMRNNQIEQAKRVESQMAYHGFKKIIATTDTSLKIKTYYEIEGNQEINLPQPSQQFINEYISEYNKGNIITEVMVKYNDFIPNNGVNLNDGYHTGLELNLKDNTINIKPTKNSWNREEVFALITTFNNAKIDAPNVLKWIENNL